MMYHRTHVRTMRQRGFTLIELMIVVALMSILAGLSIGFTGTQRREMYLKELTRGVVNALSQARAEAVGKSIKVSVSFSNTNIYAYADTNGNAKYDAGESVIYRYPSGTASINTGYTLVSKNVALSTTNTYGLNTALFDYQGYVEDYQGNPVSTVVCVTDTTPGKAAVAVRAVQLTAAGACRVLSAAAATSLCL